LKLKPDDDCVSDNLTSTALGTSKESGSLRERCAQAESGALLQTCSWRK